MAGSSYWSREIKKADKRSPKAGAVRRLDRLRGALQRLDPTISNRAWRDVAEELQRIHDRYSQ